MPDLPEKTAEANTDPLKPPDLADLAALRPVFCTNNSPDPK